MSDTAACCPEYELVRELIVLETSGEIAPDEAARLDRACARCPSCRTARHDHARTARALDDAGRLGLLPAAFPIPAGRVPAPAVGGGEQIPHRGTVPGAALSRSAADGAAPRAAAAQQLPDAATFAHRHWTTRLPTRATWARAAALLAAVTVAYVAGAWAGRATPPVIAIHDDDTPAVPGAPAHPHDPPPGDPPVPTPHDPPTVVPPAHTPAVDAAPDDPWAALARVGRHEVARLGDPESRAAAHRFLAGEGRGWLLATLAVDPVPDAALMAALAAVAPALAPAEVVALLEHHDPRVRHVALDAGAQPRLGALRAWREMLASSDVRLVERAASALLDLGPALLVADGGVWPAQLADRGLARPDWQRALARAATADDAAAAAARALLGRMPHAVLLARLTELRDADPAAAHALLAIVAAQPDITALAALVRALAEPTTSAVARAGLDRLAASAEPLALAAALLAQDSPALRAWVDQAGPHDALLLALAAADLAHPVSRRALATLAATRDPRTAALIERYLAGSEDEAFAGAAAALTAGCAPHRTTLWRLTDSHADRTRRIGLAALAMAGSATDEPRALLDRLRDGEPGWNRLVLDAAERWVRGKPRGDERLLGLLAQHVATGRAGRADAARFIAVRRLPGWTGAIEQALESVDPAVRAVALGALERPVTDACLRTVRRLRRDPDAAVKALAHRVLGALAVAAEVDALRTGLDDPDPAVRAETAVGLGLTGDPKAVQPLLAALDDPQLAVVERAAASLELVTAWSLPWPEKPSPEALDHYRRQWARWWNQNHDAGQHAWLRSAIDSGDPVRRTLAARSLARSLDPSARSLLDQARRDSGPAERARWDQPSDAGSDRELAALELSSRSLLELARGAPPELALSCALAALERDPTAALDVLVAGFGPDEPAQTRRRRHAALAERLIVTATRDEEWALWYRAARPYVAGK